MKRTACAIDFTMEATDAKEKTKESLNDRFEDIINIYLSILDHQQNEIYNVRMMHHEVWRDVHQVTGISETRAGSRVERYTRILPIGSKSDVDYKLCVEGVAIDMHEGRRLYIESSPSKAYCKLYITDKGMAVLEENELLSKLFRHSIFKCQKSERYMVKPAIFKTNVVEHCKFEMRETGEQRSPTSPAVSGEGALNPYDIVPCLMFKSWPNFIRKTVLDMYILKSSKDVPLPVFIVPTGNPLSETRDLEWRLSFAVLEIEIFRQLKSHQRRLYGLAKYLFKVVFEDLELIQSYHLKILFLRKLEDDDLTNVKPLSFLTSFFKYVLEAIENQFVPHLFIENCNIYPVHYHSDMKKEQFRLRVENNNFLSVMRKKIKTIISHDTNTDIAEEECWLENTKQALGNRQEAGLSEVWIAGYLTRLLSVIVYCLRKSLFQNKFQNAVKNLVKLVHANHHDKYINRAVPFITCLLNDVYRIDVFTDFGTQSVRYCDRVSFAIHRAFYCYERNDVDGVHQYLIEAGNTEINSGTSGIAVTKFHNGIDQSLDFAICYCQKKLNSNRFYLCPNVMRLHLIIQLRIRKINDQLEQALKQKGKECDTCSQKSFTDVKKNAKSVRTFDLETHQSVNDIAELLTELANAADTASVREPFTGKLSYKHNSFLLLKGYREQLSGSAYQALREIPLIFNQDFSLYEKKELATNFDLR
ncbi:uncharacterized protein LOC123534890 [Mercenaria mercenaria]|uniref:uncharacterized protein LOC123534890 n=1 Tax=Mercenaria mercenaria TaxID=6596 RepID=UPI00234F1CD2|nr:uncharacterized protein LOC123534890 [Mercenaria mercenaria]